VNQLTILSALHNAYVPYHQIPVPYRNPTQQGLTGPYIFAWISFLISVAFVLAFTNAMRGTLAYNQMVTTRQARDKQSALDSSELSALRSRLFGWFGNSRRALASMQAKAQAAVVARTTSVSIDSRQPAPVTMTSTEPQVLEKVAELPRLRAVPPPATIPFPAPQPEPARALPETFRNLIGVGPGPIQWKRGLAFILANLAAGLTYIGVRMATSTTRIDFPGVYWQLAFVERIGVAVAALAAFRYIRNKWFAAAAAAMAGEILALPAYAQLPNFLWDRSRLPRAIPTVCFAPNPRELLSADRTGNRRPARPVVAAGVVARRDVSRGPYSSCRECFASLRGRANSRRAAGGNQRGVRSSPQHCVCGSLLGSAPTHDASAEV
jgi:hypothetical protein